MARIIQLLEIDLSGASFRLEFGGVVALSEKDKPVAIVRVDDLAQAERLETLANALHVTFRWKQGHSRENVISVDDFEKQVAVDPNRFVPEAARERLSLETTTVTPDVERCECGIPLNLWGKCDVCTGIEYNYPGKHD